MKKYNYIIWFVLLLSLGVALPSCSDDDKGETKLEQAKLISGYQLEKQDILYVGQELKMEKVKGLKDGDVIIFKNGEKEITLPIVVVNELESKYTITDEFTTGYYTVALHRDNKIQQLGIIKITMVVTMPDKDPKSVEGDPKPTVKGFVHVGGKGLKGVRVSDGYTTYTTNDDGYYWIASEKKQKPVYLTLPSGYMPVGGNNVTPAFWSTMIKEPEVLEQHDFELEAVNNDKHMIVAATDFHVANRSTSNNDMYQFKNGFMNEVSQFISSQNVPVYTLVLGDMTWDNYWYSRTFGLSQYRDLMSNFPAPMFHIMGNHDNDPYFPEDFGAEDKYREIFGPTNFSMNIGKVHYIMLDNNIYDNKGASEGIMGSRDYKRGFTPEVLNWLKEDLAAIEDKSTPIMVGFHCPSARNYNSLFIPVFSIDVGRVEFNNSFKEFTNVSFMSGHTHFMANVDLSRYVVPEAMEHNITAVCETWWWSGFLSPGMNVSTDGSPSGYKVFDVDGTNLSWYFKGINQDKDKQFRAYDMNKVNEFFAQEDVAKVMKTVKGYKATDFTSLGENTILVNVWDYDHKWEITATNKTTGEELAVTRKFTFDPLHRLSYDYARALKDGKTETFLSEKNSHMFLIEAKDATSTIEIKVKNRFGQEFVETMERPRDFILSMD